ncbi:zinc finger protein 420-like [Sitophilus oryzae]|uniref:Zinc finger protein 420-like n=1 Tax=Sitophilus oryzae TaxID=7048 RepID=A0A6J2YUS1_SITOR|nr:zinc finger protein 420-like [Sitophilus oryzae]
MYENNFELCQYGVKKDDGKCTRIFRPWDCEDVSQDCTVSTTTQEEDEDINRNYEKDTPEEKALRNIKEIKDKNISEKEKLSLSSHTTLPEQNFPQTYSSTLPIDYLQDPYNPLYPPEVLQNNLAQHLGLSPSNPLILESLTQGYALEEYARVLNQEHEAKMLAAKKQRPKKYRCSHCNVGFSNNGQLKGHIRIHTGERPYKCDEKDCGKTFTRNEELTRHKRIHSGLRPFPCSHCGKRFGRKDHLKKHSRTHFQPRGLYSAVPVILPFETWASGQASLYPFLPMIY